VLWGILDEVHQAFVPGREASVFDGVADAVGVVTVSLIYWWRTVKRGDRRITERTRRTI
jgi:VanZ family protein